MTKKVVSILIIALFVSTTLSSVTIGKLTIDRETSSDDFLENTNSEAKVTIYEDGCCEGYTLISVMDLEDVSYTYLVDMDGAEIKHWPLDYKANKMLPGGDVIGGDILADENVDICKNITQMSWDGEVIWTFNNWDNISGEMHCRMHHDFQREGNPVGYYAPGQDFVEHGKTLILARKEKSVPKISYKELIDDVIYEVDWDGNFTGFEWHASDHFDQMGFDWKAKIGIYLNPGLGILKKGDWLHINSVSRLGKNKWYDSGDERFHPNNIIIDSRHANFIAIIDNETGDIVWRVGPDFSTLKPNKDGKLGQLIGQHHAHMISDGLPGAGNILVFDNGGMAGYGLHIFPNRIRSWSRVVEFNPVTLDIVWVYKARRFFSFFISSAQRHPNGNTLITEGYNELSSKKGRIFEVTPNKEIVWEYLLPPEDAAYRAYRIPPEWVPGNPSGYHFWEE